jgi:hypothetical protein
VPLAYNSVLGGKLGIHRHTSPAIGSLQNT